MTVGVRMLLGFVLLLYLWLQAMSSLHSIVPGGPALLKDSRPAVQNEWSETCQSSESRKKAVKQTFLA